MFKRGACFYRCAICLFFVFNLSLSAQEPPVIPQQVLDWQKAAQDSAAQNNTIQAVEYYQLIQQNFPDTSYALIAQKSIVMVYLWSNQMDKTMAAIAELTKVYSRHPNYVVQMEEIIDRLADTNHAAEAKGLCESMLAQFGDDLSMVWIMQRKARSDVWMKRPDLADVTVKVMQQKYADHPSYAEVMSWMAYEYYRTGYYPRARDLYSDILSLNPADRIQLRCKAGVALVYLGQGDTAGVGQAVEQLKTGIGSCKEDVRIEDVAEMVRLTDTDQTVTVKEVCGALFARFPNDPWMIWVLQRKVRSEVIMRQGDSADATTKVIQQKYAGHPEYAKVMRLTACEYRRAFFYSRALELYNEVLSLNPDQEIQLSCRAGVVQVYLGQGDTANALKMAEQVKNSIQSCTSFQVEEVEEMITNLIDANQAAAAEGVCDGLLARFPDDARMIWIAQRKARSQVLLKHADLADATVAMMQQKYTGHPSYTDALSWTAYEYHRAGFYSRAMELYNEVLGLKLAENIQLRCTAGIARTYARLGDDARVQEKVDSLLSNFKENPDGLASCLFDIGQEYYSMAFTDSTYGQRAENSSVMFNKAIKIWQTPAYPDSSRQKLETTQFIATAYLYLRQYDEAIAVYKEAMNANPDYLYKSNILRLMGICYAAKAENGMGDPNEAIANAELAWQTVVEKYPNDPMSFDAAMRLTWIKERKGQWQEAVDAYKFFLSHCGKDPRKVQTMFKLGNAYEQAGQKDLALTTYSDYIRMAPVGDRYIPQAASALLRLEGVK